MNETGKTICIRLYRNVTKLFETNEYQIISTRNKQQNDMLITIGIKCSYQLQQNTLN